jgi:hypothetical protein
MAGRATSCQSLRRSMDCRPPKTRSCVDRRQAPLNCAPRQCPSSLARSRAAGTVPHARSGFYSLQDTLHRGQPGKGATTATRALAVAGLTLDTPNPMALPSTVR